MTIGPLTIRWTKDIEADAARVEAKARAIWAETMAEAEIIAKHQAFSNAVRNKVVARLLHQNNDYKAVLRRWGLDYGLLGIGVSQESKPPKGVVGVL